MRLREVFAVFDERVFDEEKARVAVRFSPEEEAFFRAWVQCQTVLLRAEWNSDPS